MSEAYPTPPMLPGGIPSVLKASAEIYLESGKGGRCKDQTGKEYVDWICSFGTLILGHANDEVNHSVMEQMKSGSIFPSFHPFLELLDTTLQSLYPYARGILLLKTGSEAISAAIRLARAFTNKPKIIRCGFHGWHDTVISPHISWHIYEKDSKLPREATGVLSSSPDHIALRWDGEDLQQLEDLFAANRGQIAAFLIDPVQLREPLGENLSEIMAIVRRNETLFIFDEAKTCFRVSLAGVQGLYGVEPDLTILSKGMSNGFPLSIVLGRPEIMKLGASARIMGTYNNELLSVVSALKTIEILQREQGPQKLWQTGEQLIDGINEVFERWSCLDNIQTVAYRWPCMPFIWFKSQSEWAQSIKPLFYRNIERGGVLMLPDHMNFTCLTHTEDDISHTVDVVDYAMRSCLRA